ncbi:MAG: hypothetical protein WBE80_10745 [Methylocella sp.]
MFVISLETGSESGLFCECRCRWLPPRFSIPMNLGMNLGLRGFAHLGSNSNYKEWRFFGDR